LIDTQGRPVTDASLLGKPTAIFFGFTYCPEVCPTTLAEMTAALADLGPVADQLNVVFVTVDPERDTPDQMRLYLSNFDHRIQGFTGPGRGGRGEGLSRLLPQSTDGRRRLHGRPLFSRLPVRSAGRIR
jgi:cytochrome oxidase Cu insertion factor (SCO1/SenC/PrrC family)